MAAYRKVTDSFWVGPQLRPEDLAAVAADGARMIINNRPDFEEPGQPTGAELAAAARAAGLDYAEIPVAGAPGPDQAQAMRAAAEAAQGPVLAFCRSGTRSILLWALTQLTTGARDREDVLALARNAGFDLSRWI